MFYIKDLANKVENENLHKIFRRYSRGTFPKELIEFKKTAKKTTAKGGPNLLNDFLEFIVKYDNSSKYEIKGKIIAKSSKEVMQKLEIPIKKSTGKGDKVDVETIVTRETFLDLYNTLKNENLLLTIKCENFELKSKTSLGKPGSLIENFCRISILSEKMQEAFDAEFSSFFTDKYKSISMKQNFIIENIIIDETLPPAQMAKKAKREGIIKLDLNIDKEEFEKKVKFIA